MRRTASEVLHDLEIRVARLERSAAYLSRNEDYSPMRGKKITFSVSDNAGLNVLKKMWGGTLEQEVTGVLKKSIRGLESLSVKMGAHGHLNLSMVVKGVPHNLTAFPQTKTKSYTHTVLEVNLPFFVFEDERGHEVFTLDSDYIKGEVVFSVKGQKF